MSDTVNKRRLVYTLSFLVGKHVRVTKNDQSIVTGVLVGGDVNKSNDLFVGISLRYAVQGKDLIGSCNLNWNDVKEIFILNGGFMIDSIAKPEHARLNFQTDTDISSRGKSTARKLESANNAWLSSGGGDLNDGDTGNFDQFKTNAEKFGVKSTFDERLYTTELDMSQLSTEQRKKAETLAREIESKTSTNIHLQEERGQLGEDPFNGDEEARFSSVLRSDDPKAYKPPHKRDLSWASKVKGPKDGTDVQSTTEEAVEHAKSLESVKQPEAPPVDKTTETLKEVSKPKALNPTASEWKPKTTSAPSPAPTEYHYQYPPQPAPYMSYGAYPYQQQYMPPQMYGYNGQYVPQMQPNMHSPPQHHHHQEQPHHHHGNSQHQNENS